MKAEAALWGACSEWERLAKAASLAIESRNWPLVDECHRVISNIQSEIQELHGRACSEWIRQGIDPKVAARRFQPIVLGLIRQVESNISLLKRVRARVDGEFRQGQEAGRNLRRLQQSYAAVHHTAWSTLS